MSNHGIPIIWIIFIVYIFISLLTIPTLYKKVRSGKAIIRKGFGGTRISFNGIFVIPIFHIIELLDIQFKRLDYAFQLKDIDLNDVKIELVIDLKIRRDKENILNLVNLIGSEKLSLPNMLKEHFSETIENAVQKSVSKFDRKAIIHRDEKLKELTLEYLVGSFEGFEIEDLFIKVCE